MTDMSALNVVVLGRHLVPDVEAGAVVGLVVRLGTFDMDAADVADKVGDAVTRYMAATEDRLDLPEHPEAGGLMDVSVVPANSAIGPMQVDPPVRGTPPR